MPDLFILWTLGGPALMISSTPLFTNGHYVWAAVMLLLGCMWTGVRVFYKPGPYRYTVENCPHKGEKPVYGAMKGGFHWFNYSVGEDDNTMVACESCGYRTTAVHINPLTQVRFRSKLLGLNIQPRPDLLPTHP